MILLDSNGNRTVVVPVLGAMSPERGHRFAVLDTNIPAGEDGPVLVQADVYRAYHNPAELVAVGFAKRGQTKFLFDGSGKLIPSRPDDPNIGCLWLLQVRDVVEVV